MNRRTAIEWLESIKHGVHGGDEEFDRQRKEALDMAITGMKPVKPRFDGDIWRCGECGHVVECLGTRGDYILINERHSYCPNCGKPVRWTNETGEPTNDNK